jgi:hypothetical protein
MFSQADLSGCGVIEYLHLEYGLNAEVWYA